MTNDVKNLGEPLTIEQLREMDGEPVWLSIAGGVFGIVCVSDGCVVMGPSQEIDIVVLDGLAYRYPPVATELQPNCNEPLTIDQLRGMDGEPVLLVFDFEPEPMISLIEYAQDDDCIILTNNLGGRSKFYSDEELMECGIKVYAYQSVATDTNVGGKDINVNTSINLDSWEPCEYCKGERMPYQHTHSTKLFIDTFGSARTLVTECNACPPYANCCAKDISVNSAFPINFCPNCGKPMTEEARAMLEKRLRGCTE